MKLNEVIRKYRKAKGLTQEEMASYLGVTAPAVNKWENGNTTPDLMLIAPIARLLNISLNELLSFKEELTPEEIEELVKKANQKFLYENYKDVFSWIKKQIQLYPNCESLIYNLTLLLDINKHIKNIPENEEYDKFILNCYERLFKSDDENMKITAADALHKYYLHKNQYEKSEECLSFYSVQSSEQKRKLAVIYEKKGNLEKACQIYEEILMREYQVILSIFNSLLALQLQNKNLKKVAYYIDKKKTLITLFEMGKYNLFAADLDLLQAQQNEEETLECVNDLLNNIDSIYSFMHAPLYSHIKFKTIDPNFTEEFKKNLIYNFRYDTSFKYMSNNPKWKKIILESE